jgi:hypothetical protein
MVAGVWSDERLSDELLDDDDVGKRALFRYRLTLTGVERFDSADGSLILEGE